MSNANGDAKDAGSLKRGREGSLEPSLPPTAVVAPKKNRLEPDDASSRPESIAEDAADEAAAEAYADADVAAEDEGRPAEAQVGEVRKQVEKMGWKEGEVADGDKIEAEGAADAGEAAEGARPAVVADAGEGVPEQKEGEALKRKTLERGQSTVEPEEIKRRKSASPDPVPAPATAPAKKQATFASFSSGPSPFARAGASASAFGSGSAALSAAGPSGSSSSTPAATATSASTPSASSTPAPAPATSAMTTATAGGFKSYTSAFSAFAKKPVVPAATPAASFGDILSESRADEGEGEGEAKVALDKQDVPTGEEEEETIHQTRAKLFVMQEDGGWKERGIGVLKLNVRQGDRKGARLVMRADGVLRVILNASLYAGMTCLEDGKHVRTTVFEGKARRLVTFRVGNPKAASELATAIHEHVPLETRAGAEPSPAPAGPTSKRASAGAGADDAEADKENKAEKAEAAPAEKAAAA
ncbi:hypothetical protein Q5752_005925 [Cryptotrichosporon argae]